MFLVSICNLKSICLSIAAPPLFWLPFVWNLFCLFTFSLRVSLKLELISGRQHIVGSSLSFFNPSASLKLWIEEFYPPMLRVIIDKLVLTIAILLFSCCFVVPLFCFLSLAVFCL